MKRANIALILAYVTRVAYNVSDSIFPQLRCPIALQLVISRHESMIHVLSSVKNR